MGKGTSPESFPQTIKLISLFDFKYQAAWNIRDKPLEPVVVTSDFILYFDLRDQTPRKLFCPFQELKL